MSNYKIKNSNSILADIMKGHSHSNYKGQNSKSAWSKKDKKEGRHVDKNTFVCPVCDKGWEYALTSNGYTRKNTLLYSQNILKYKKKRKICRLCKDVSKD